MLQSMERTEQAAGSVYASSSIEGLSLIHNPGCAAAIWERTPEQGFQTWIASLNESKLPQARVTLPLETLPTTIRDIFDDCETSNCTQRDTLIKDTINLAESFAKIMSVSHVQLRFDIIRNNACRKFHVDAIKARLICTYLGTGTQYGISKNNTDPQEIFTLPTGSPMILRGSLWPETPKSGLLHRSPPIEGKTETRLLLVIDPIES